jgi:hypothetical protein
MKKSTKTSSKSSSSTGPLTVSENMSTSIRKIENGFIVSENGYTGSGKTQKWVNKEYFSDTNPLAGVKGKVKFGK